MTGQTIVGFELRQQYAVAPLSGLTGPNSICDVAGKISLNYFRGFVRKRTELAID